MTKDHKLILLKASIRRRKEKDIYILTESNVFPGLSLEEGLYVMDRCGLPLWAAEGLIQASFVGDGKDIACYERYGDETVLAFLCRKRRPVPYREDIILFPSRPESTHLSGLSGRELNKLVEDSVRRIKEGKRLSQSYVEDALRKARLSLVPDGWKTVHDGMVETGDRYLSEDRPAALTITPALVSWMSCDVSFSEHKPGSPVKKYPWSEDIIIRKKQTGDKS